MEFDISLFQKNIPLKDHNTYRIGGSADLFFDAINGASLIAAIRELRRHGISYYLLGGGTNVLVPDDGFRGAIVKARHAWCDANNDVIVADAGMPMGALVTKAQALGLSGLEWAAGLPGTVGGAVFGNAGSHGGEMKDAVIAVEVYDPATDRIEECNTSACGFGYRHSAFQENGKIIVRVYLQLRSDDPSTIAARMQEIMVRRAAHQPIGQRSEGCVFRNIELAHSEAGREAVAHHEELSMFCDAKFLPAGAVIDKAGLKGVRIGGAFVSERHGNFIVNEGDATARDIIALIETIRARVKEKYALDLSEEIKILRAS